MRRLRVVVALFALGTCLCACGETVTPDVAALLEKADAAFARGEAAARDASAPGAADLTSRDRSASVAAWAEAGEGYRSAFRLLDPLPPQRQRRAMVAFRAARSFAKAAQAGSEAGMREFRAETALLWLSEVDRLAPEMERQVWFERGALRDSDVDGIRDPARAHAAFSRYLDLVGKIPSPPESERERIAHARARVKALAPPKDDGNK